MKAEYPIGNPKSPDFKLVTPTDEQYDIIAATLNGKDNLSLVARAGSAKSTTLEMLAQELPTKKVLCLAFNKAIAMELKQRLPINCHAMTLNGLGHKMVGRFLPKFPQLNADKCFDLVREHAPRNADFMAVLDALKATKRAGYVNHPRAKSLMTADEFFGSFKLRLTESEVELVKKLSELSMEQVIKDQIIDFDDQILCSVALPCSAPDRYDVILIDEAQDLSTLNHKMLKKIAGIRSRVIAVGLSLIHI